MQKKLVLINKNTLEALEETEVLKIIEKFVNTGIQVLGADFGFMFWKSENQDKYQLVYKTPSTPYEPKLPRKRGYNYQASKKRIPYFVTAPSQYMLAYMKSFAILPIFYKNYQYGNIALGFNKKRFFKEEEKPLINALSNSMAQVLTIYRHHKKAERVSLKLLKQKDEFFNIVSHELNTPVTTIKGFAQILTNKLKNTDDKEKYYLDKINSHIDKLSRLINDLLNVSRIETGKMKFEKDSVELQRLARQAIESLKVAVPSHPLSFQSDYQFWVQGDSARLEEVIINLVTNAAKYSSPGSKIKVCLTEKDNKACLEVEDFGYGITEKDHAKVFNRFFQSKNLRKEHAVGLGLGLFIANSIVKAHDGVLDFKSKKNSKGTIFYFTLPYYRCRAHKSFIK